MVDDNSKPIIEHLEAIHNNYLKTILNKKSKLPVSLANSSHLTMFMEETITMFRGLNGRIKDLEKDNEIDLETIKLGGTDG